MNRKEYIKRHGFLAQFGSFWRGIVCFVSHRNHWEYYVSGSSYTGYEWSSVCKLCIHKWKHWIKVFGA